MRGAWIEISETAENMARAGSLPMRGAWIEMFLTVSARFPISVAPHVGSVD